MAELDPNIVRLVHEEERLCRQLEQLQLMKDKPFYEHCRNLLEKQLLDARNDAKEAFKRIIKVDERNAYRAVLRSTYKKILGGSVKILNGKTSHERRGVPEPTGGKRGIRRHRTVSGRTAKQLTYTGLDAGFILRFINSGTDIRTARADVHGRGSKSTWGARSVIGKRDVFAKAVRMDERARKIANAIEEYVKQHAIDNI